MWPHLGKEAKERKNEPVQQSQPGPLEPSASTLLTPAPTLQVGLHPPHSSPCRPPLSPPQGRLAPCPRPRRLLKCTQAHRGPTRPPAMHSARTCMRGELLTQDDPTPPLFRTDSLRESQEAFTKRSPSSLCCPPERLSRCTHLAEPALRCPPFLAG